MDDLIPGVNTGYGSGTGSTPSGSTGPTLLDYLNFGGKTASGVLGALNNRKVTVSAGSTTNWPLIGGIAAAVLGVLLLLMVVSKK